VPTTAVVFAGGDPPGTAVVERLPRGAFVVAADSGLDHADALGVAVDLVIGDLDSVSSASLEAARTAGTAIDEHPEDKDATDLALALDVVEREGVTELVVVGGAGGRVDHLLGNVLLIADPSRRFTSVDLYAAATRVHIVRDRRTLPAVAGELCSLLPLHGNVRGVHTEGLHWALAGDDLAAGTSRGLSNRAIGPEVVVAVASGTLAVVFPGDAR
jgi:thiamine pyrophosphokinase